MRNRPLSEIAGRLDLKCGAEIQVSGYQVDSRRIGSGEMFFALTGAKVDGHAFLADVAARGGIAAVVSNAYTGPNFGLNLFAVPDVLACLHNLAREFLAESNAIVVGITGSMGKTTTKDFTATLLEGKFRVGKTYSSYNTRLTLPITILNLVGDEEVVVLEMGMGELGDIAKLVAIAPPNIAVLTNVTMAHYGSIFPDGITGVAKAKAEIFGSSKIQKAIFFHELDEEIVGAISCEKLSFSLKNSAADYFLSDSVVDERGVRAHRFSIPFTQPHVHHNFLAAVSVARALGMDWVEIDSQVDKLKLPKMRFEQFEREGIIFVNDAYNANPESMKAALSCFPTPSAGGKRIAVLGRMVDLGPFSVDSHSEVGQFARGYADHLITLGNEAMPLNEAFAEGMKPAEHYTNLKEVIARLKELMTAGDVVLVKGSRDLAMETIFDKLKEN